MLGMKPITQILGIDDKKGFDLRRNAATKEYVVSDVHIIGNHEVAKIREDCSAPSMAQTWWGCRRCNERLKMRDDFKEVECHGCNCEFCNI